MRFPTIAASTCAAVFSVLLATAAPPQEPAFEDLTALPRPRGTLAPGEVRELPFVVPEATLLRFITSGDLRFAFRSPTGVTYTASDAGRIPGFRHHSSSHEEHFDDYDFDDPSPGTWTLRVDASQCAEPREFDTLVWVLTPFRVHVEPPHVKPGENGPATMWIERDGNPVKGTSWTCELVRDEKHLRSIVVFDDGRHGDVQPGDGIVGASIKTGASERHYEIQASATLPAALGGATLVAMSEFDTWAKQDLLTVPGSVWLSETLVHADDRVKIVAAIANHSTSAVSKLEVKFLDGPKPLGSVYVDLAAGETCEVELPWTVIGPESHELSVAVSTSRLDEIDYSNNTATMTFELGRPLPWRDAVADRVCKQARDPGRTR